jgi:hypothetical protein
VLHNEQVALLEAGAYASKQRNEGDKAAAGNKDDRSKVRQVAQVLRVLGVDARGVQVEYCVLVVCFDYCAGCDEQAANREKTWRGGEQRMTSAAREEACRGSGRQE